ncbi:MAG TPA: sugar transferase [Dehalococcoidia bacterium]|nr:sugar transferase [Dehalococcoidia bacterium]
MRGEQGEILRVLDSGEERPAVATSEKSDLRPEMEAGGSPQAESVDDYGLRHVPCYPTPPAKRLVDLSLSVLALAVLWPVWLLAVFLIKLDSPGPALLSQPRVGLRGRKFSFYKFRTLAEGPADDLAERIPQGDLTQRLISPRGRNPRATNIGWVLRKTTVDELPQLLNVVKGDMSLVGPRPDMPLIVAHWPQSFLQRHKVKPGMTGLAQVNGRSDLTHYQKVCYDLEYVRYHPLSRDLRILLKTIALVVSKKGAR